MVVLVERIDLLILKTLHEVGSGLELVLLVAWVHHGAIVVGKIEVIEDGIFGDLEHFEAGGELVITVLLKKLSPGTIAWVR